MINNKNNIYEPYLLVLSSILSRHSFNRTYSYNHNPSVAYKPFAELILIRRQKQKTTMERKRCLTLIEQSKKFVERISILLEE